MSIRVLERSGGDPRGHRRKARSLHFPGVLWALLASGALAPASATRYRVHPDSAAVGFPYFATVLEANAVAAAGDSVEVSTAGSPYIHSNFMPLVSGVVYRGGFGPEFEGPNTALYETTIELQPGVGVFDSVIETGAADAATVFAGFTVTGGNSSFSGGGIACVAGSALTVRNCRVVRNYADGIGGGIHIANGSSARVFNCDLEENVARLRGGGFSVAAGATGASIEFCRVVACSAATEGASDGGGGGIFCASPIVISRCEIRNCWSGFNGGGLLARNTNLSGQSNQWIGNVAERNGGGAYHETGGDGEHLASSFERCVARNGNGGGLAFDGGTWLVMNSFVRACTSSARGGGIYWNAPLGAELRLTELVGNRANEGGGLGVVGNLFRSVLSLHVESCTIALNSALAANEPGAGIQVFPEGNFADAILDCIIAEQVVGCGITCEGALNQPNIRYCCVWNRDATNPDDEYGRGCADRTGINGNIGQNPRFCDLAATPPQVSVDQFSPCLGAGETGGDLGAHPGSSACAFVSVEPATWGRVKSLYR